MYETRAKLNSRTLTLINEVGSIARRRMKLLPNQQQKQQIACEELCLRALNHAVAQYGYYTIDVLCQIIMLAEVYVRKARFEDFEIAFNEAERIYMCLANEPESDNLLDSLINLGWKLCTVGRGSEARRVNSLIAQIKSLNEDAPAES